MKKLFTLIVLCLTLQVGNAQIISSTLNKLGKLKTTKKTTTTTTKKVTPKKAATTTKKTTTAKKVPQRKQQPSEATLSRYEVANFLGLNHYDNNAIVRMMSGYEWVVKGKSEVQREFFPEEISYRTYPSHPNYRLYGHSLFDNQGQLKAVLVLQYSYGKYVWYEDKEIGMADILLKCIMAKAYKNNAYQVNLASYGVREEIEKQLASGTTHYYNEDAQKAKRYCEQLREDCAKKINQVSNITRVDACSFRVQFADENGNATYSGTVKFSSDGAYKVTYDIYLPEGTSAELHEIRGDANSKGSKENAYNATTDGKVYEVVEVQPSFPGGNGALNSWLRDNLRYPVVAQENSISGNVIVQFVVGKDGSITDARVSRGVDPSLDKEAVRVVKSMPRWTPGKQDGKPVNVRYTLPVVFRLN